MGAGSVTKHDVYAFISTFLEKHGRAPEQAEFEKALKSHWNAIKQHMLRLHKEGAVSWEFRDLSTMRLGTKPPKTDRNAEKPPKAKKARPSKSEPKVRSLAGRVVPAPAPSAATPSRVVSVAALDALKQLPVGRIETAIDEIIASAPTLAQQLVQLAEQLGDQHPTKAVSAPAPKVARGPRAKAKKAEPIEAEADDDEQEPAPTAPRHSTDKPFRVENAKQEEMGDGFDTLTDAQHFCRRNSDAARIYRNADDKIMPKVG